MTSLKSRRVGNRVSCVNYGGVLKRRAAGKYSATTTYVCTRMKLTAVNVSNLCSQTPFFLVLSRNISDTD